VEIRIVHTHDKGVVFLIDVIDDVSFATQVTTKVYLPDNSVEEWTTIIVDKHYFQITADIGSVYGFYRLQPEILQPLDKSRTFKATQIFVKPRES
jgi:hypothetical protein